MLLLRWLQALFLRWVFQCLAFELVPAWHSHQQLIQGVQEVNQGAQERRKDWAIENSRWASGTQGHYANNIGLRGAVVQFAASLICSQQCSP